MKRLIKCKCGNDRLLVEDRTDHCDDCNHNRCTRVEDGHCTVGHGVCPSATDRKACVGYESEAYEEYQCEIGDSYGKGCWIVMCPECGKAVDNLPFSEG